MTERASPELALKAAEELLERQRARIRELQEDRERLLKLEAAVRVWDRCGCIADARCPHEEAVLDALEGRDD